MGITAAMSGTVTTTVMNMEGAMDITITTATQERLLADWLRVR
jgi:hypothetical protein